MIHTCYTYIAFSTENKLTLEWNVIKFHFLHAFVSFQYKLLSFDLWYILSSNIDLSSKYFFFVIFDISF